jgi:hypothetical protein
MQWTSQVASQRTCLGRLARRRSSTQGMRVERCHRQYVHLVAQLSAVSCCQHPSADCNYTCYPTRLTRPADSITASE